MERYCNRFAAFFLLTLLFCAVARAQVAQVKKSPSPYYVGEPIALQLIVRGLEQTPEPEVRFDDQSPEELAIAVTGISPQVSQSITNINGNVTRRVSVVHYVNFQVTASESGRFELPPIVVSQDGTEFRTEPIQLDFRAVETNDTMQIALTIPERDFFVGEHVPVTLTWNFLGQPSEITKLSIRSPLFDKFEFIDSEIKGQTVIPIETSKGTVELPATARRSTVSGETRYEVQIERTMIMDEVGEFKISPVAVTCRVGASRRDPFDGFFSDSIFGRRPASPGVPRRAVGRPLQFVVRPLPSDERPASFSGAVGSGFTMNVRANRSVVRVGDPIAITITIGGAGNLDRIGLPDLSTNEAFTKGFSMPDGQPAGVVGKDGKQFSISVRVTEPTVQEFPPLEFAWFDPNAGVYETTKSAPVALRVMPANVVSAEDVVSSVPSSAASPVETTRTEGASINRPDELGSVTGSADLAIETDVDRLAEQRRRPWDHPLVPTTVYFLGIAAMGWGVVERRRREVDPAVIERRRTFRLAVDRVANALSGPRDDAAAKVAEAMRSILPYASLSHRSDGETLLRRLETIVYAPRTSGARQQLDRPLWEDCRQWIERVQRESS